MSKPIHGGGVDRAMAELGFTRSEMHDFSASINPLGMPSQVKKAVTAALDRVGDYPEIEAASLRQELAEFHGLAEENILPGSGSTELIYLLPRVFRPRRALLVLPCFSEYAPALRQAGCEIDTVSLSPVEDFAFSVAQIVGAVKTDTDLVMLANPGNPTGISIDPQLLLELAAELGDCRLLIDEAFVDYCPQRSVLNQVCRYPNLLVLRSMTKFYAIPGLRVGYLTGSMINIATLAAQKEPWTMSNLAIAAGKACLGAVDYQCQTLQQTPGLRAELQKGLERLGIKVFPSEVNYLLCRLPKHSVAAGDLESKLRKQGLLIRCCADFLPLDERFFRVAVLSKTANDFLLTQLSTLLD